MQNRGKNRQQKGNKKAYTKTLYANYAKNMQKKTQYAKNMLNMQKLCSIRTTCTTCNKYSTNMQQICNKYAANMQFM